MCRLGRVSQRREERLVGEDIGEILFTIYRVMLWLARRFVPFIHTPLRRVAGEEAHSTKRTHDLSSKSFGSHCSPGSEIGWASEPLFACW